MHELIPINYEREIPTVSARDLYGFLGLEPGNYSRWSQQNILNNPYASEDTDYSVFFTHEENPLGGRPTTDYALTIDFSKKLCMISKSKKGEEIRDYFIEVEKEHTAQKFNLPTDYLSALKVLVVSEEAKAKLLSENSAQKERIAILEPKAEFFDAVADSKTAIDMSRAAKVLDMGIGRNELFAFLRDKEVLMGDNVPYQAYVDRGYFRTIEQKYSRPDGSIHISIKTLVFQKGLEFIRRLYQKEKGGFGLVEAN